MALMPREISKTYRYNIGEPWDYGTIIAEDSFPVMKSQESLNIERDSLKRYYEPYFQIDADIQRQQIKAWYDAYENELKGTVPTSFKTHIAERLAEIYGKGIVTNNDYESLNSKGILHIRTFLQNESYVTDFTEIFTAKSAYKYILHDPDSVAFPHSKLMDCGLNRFLVPNLKYDVAKSTQQEQEVDNSLTIYLGKGVQVGQKIVDRGQILDSYTYCVLKSMEKYQQEKEKTIEEKLLSVGGQTIYTAIIVILLFSYFNQFRRDYLNDKKSVLLVLTMFLSFPVITYVVVEHASDSIYLVPYCIVPIFIRIFMDSRTAFMLHLCIILICAIVVPQPYEFMLVQMAAGITAVFSLSDLTERVQLFSAVLLVIFIGMLTYASVDMVRGDFSNLIDDADIKNYICIGLSGILLMLSYLLLLPFEKMFGFISSITLLELSNANNPILRQMSEVAPGTFQHSMQVANLSAEVARRIGAKVQLVRTGALYHDIGKIRHAVFFTENQNGINPHTRLTNEQSAQIIISHVREGLQLADKYKLPQVIKDFIVTHHGKSMARYFYVQAQNKTPDTPIDPTLFTYPGPNPFTMEQAILMMADSLEAASRSLNEYNEENINNLVDRIVDAQLAGGYFKECPITFKDIDTAKDVFKTKLRIIYHTRIQYPELKTPSIPK